MKTLFLAFLALIGSLCLSAAPHAADVASQAATAAAVERMKRDVPRFQEWNVNELSLPQTLTAHLAPLTAVELSPKETSRVTMFVVAADAAKPQTWRPSNDADLAAIVDKSSLKRIFNHADPTTFAQALASLRCAPEEAKLINAAADIPDQQGEVGQPIKADVRARLGNIIQKWSVTTENGETKLKFFFLSGLGGGVYEMNVHFRAHNAPTTVQTVFHGYAYFTTR
jgi:hypothetical protein